MGSPFHTLNHLAAMLLLMLAASSGAAPIAWTYDTGNYLWAVAVSRDGRYVMAGSDDMRAYFFDTASAQGKPLWSYMTKGYVRYVTVSRNGSYAATGDSAGYVLFFRSDRAGTPVWSYKAGASISGLVMSDDGDYLVAGDRHGAVYLFGTGLTEPLIWRSAVPGGVLALGFSKVGSLAVAASSGGLFFFSQIPSELGYAWSFRQYVTFPHVSIIENSDYIAAGATDGYVYLIGMSGELADRQSIGGSVSALSSSATTRRIVAGSTNGNVSLYLIRRTLEVQAMLTTPGPVTSVVISENGERVSVANLDGTISMLDQSLTSYLWTFPTGAVVHSLSMSDDGLVMGAGSDTGSVYLFLQKDHLSSGRDAWPIVLALAVVVIAATIGYYVWLRQRKRQVSQQDPSTSKAYGPRSPSSQRELS